VLRLPGLIESCCPAPAMSPSGMPTNRVDADHGRLKARLRPMHGLKQERSLRILVLPHGFAQNARRGHYELASDVALNQRLLVAFEELALTL
jgi:IS6 family transposase